MSAHLAQRANRSSSWTKERTKNAPISHVIFPTPASAKIPRSQLLLNRPVVHMVAWYVETGAGLTALVSPPAGQLQAVHKEPDLALCASCILTPGYGRAWDHTPMSAALQQLLFSAAQ